MISERHAKEYCRDDISKIENYEQAINDKENKWVCHHRLELTLNGEYAHGSDSLKRLGVYYNRPYFELIFMKESDHISLHQKAREHKPLSKEHKKKLSIAHTGKKLTDEHKKHIGEAFKDRKRPEISKAMKGKPTSEFGKKFKEHYGITCTDNENFYKNEWHFWKHHNKTCRWEINNDK